MKRKNNGLILGTILFVLVGALVLIQFLNQEPTEVETPAPMPTAPPTTPGQNGPRVNDILDNNSGRSPVPAPQ